MTALDWYTVLITLAFVLLLADWFALRRALKAVREFNSRCHALIVDLYRAEK